MAVHAVHSACRATTFSSGRECGAPGDGWTPVDSFRGSLASRDTHTFHLPCGEMTVTLLDVAMILGLPLEGHAVTRIVQSDGWRDMVDHWDQNFSTARKS